MEREVVEEGVRPEGFSEENLEEPQEGEFERLVGQLRKKRGFSLRMLARRARVDASNLSKALRGKSHISFEGVCRLADVLRVSPVRMLEAAGKLQDFPYDMLESEGVREACRKLAEGKRLAPKDKDYLVELWYAWRTPPKPRGRKRKEKGDVE